MADRLTKWYGSRVAVAEVSFEVRVGEVLGLLGPNGSGKTTILRILTGYLHPSSGSASVAGLDVVRDSLSVRERVGYVAEGVPLYDGMRVEEFLVFMARVKGVRGAAVRAAVGGVSERLGLGAVRRLQIGKLSRGFRQRVAVAQALLNDPEVLVLDEPTNGLDPHQIIETRQLIRSLAGTHTVLISSHVLGEVAKVADRVAILLDGRMLAVRGLGASPGAARFRLRVAGPEDEVRACLHAVPGVRALGVGERGNGGFTDYTVELEGESKGVVRLAAALVGRGFALAELREDPVNLEQLFLELTRQQRETSR